MATVMRVTFKKITIISKLVLEIMVISESKKRN